MWICSLAIMIQYSFDVYVYHTYPRSMSIDDVIVQMCFCAFWIVRAIEFQRR